MMKQETLKDQHGRVHNYLRLSLTEKCNLRCAYCMPAEGIPLLPSSKLMSAEEVFKISESFVKMGVNKIRLTGGEPLVRKDFPEILKKLATLPVSLAISTNGVLLEKFLPLFKETGLRKINISLDSLLPEKFFQITRRDQFKKVQQSINLLLEQGFELKVNVVLIKGFNDDEIIEFIKFTKDKALDIRFIEFMPFDGNNWNADKTVSLESILHKAEAYFGKALQVLETHKNDTTKLFKIEGYKGNWGIISTVTSHFCSGCNRLRVTADGKMKNCLFSNSEMDLLNPIRNGKPIDNLVRIALWDKKAVRAGMDSPEKFSNPNLNGNNRSMIAIGG